MLAIIGGSGLASLVGMTRVQRRIARTPWGDPSAALSVGDLAGRTVVFLARHGYGHTIAPQDINYRANIQALHDAGVSGIVAVSTVGGIRDDLTPGSLVVPDQLIDYTSGRENTYFSGVGRPVTHVDFTHPYDRLIRTTLVEQARQLGEPVIDGGCYGCTSGPRFETAAEVGRMGRDGCDLVGMTGMPEAVLARELKLPYAALCVVSNAAAGRGTSADGIAFESIHDVLEETMGRVTRVLAAVVGAIG